MRKQIAILSEERATFHTLCHDQDLKISQTTLQLEKFTEFNDQLKEKLKTAVELRDEYEQENIKLKNELDNFENEQFILKEKLEEK